MSTCIVPTLYLLRTHTCSVLAPYPLCTCSVHAPYRTTRATGFIPPFLHYFLMVLPIVWLLALLEQSFHASNFVPQNGACASGTSSYHLWITLITFVVLHFFVPVILVTVLYGHMIFRLRSLTNIKNDATSARRNDVMKKAKKNVFKTMLLITVCYTLCYVCNNMYATLYLLGIIKAFTGKYYFDITKRT